MLESPNGWQRDAAQRLLIGRNEPSLIGPLRQLAASSQHPLARLHALSTLDGMGALTPADLQTALADRHRGVRRHAVLLAARWPVDVARLVTLADDPDAKVRLQLAATLGAVDGSLAAQTLAKLAADSADDIYITANVMSSLHQGNIADVLSAYLKRIPHLVELQPSQRELQRKLFAQVAALGNAGAIGRIIELSCQSGDQTDRAWQMSWLADLLDGLGNSESWQSKVSQRHRDLIAQSIQQARRIVADRSVQSLPETVSAIRLLLRQPDAREQDLRLLSELLVPQSAVEVQTAVIDRLAELTDPTVPVVLLAGWNAYGPILRSRVLNVLASRTIWSQTLLAQINNGEVSSADISPALQQLFLSSADEALRASWGEIFAKSQATDRKQIVQDFRSALQLRGDPDRGAAVFQKSCSACHQLGTNGPEIGPNLAAITDRRPEALLSAILDPNAAVEAQYLTYTALTVDGRVLSGLLKSETGSSITLLTAEGKQVTVLRKDIDQLRATGKSMMPAGLEKDLAAQDIADLIEHLRRLPAVGTK